MSRYSPSPSACRDRTGWRHRGLTVFSVWIITWFSLVPGAGGRCWPAFFSPLSAKHPPAVSSRHQLGSTSSKKGISLWTETFSYDDWRRTHGCHKVLIQIRCLGNTTPWFYKATCLGRALGEFLNGPLEGSRKPCLKLHPWILQELFANFFASLLEFFMPGHGEAALQRRASEHCEGNLIQNSPRQTHTIKYLMNQRQCS